MNWWEELLMIGGYGKESKLNEWRAKHFFELSHNTTINLEVAIGTMDLPYMREQSERKMINAIVENMLKAVPTNWENDSDGRTYKGYVRIVMVKP